MRLICLFVLLFTSVASVAAGALPKEVSSFIEQREACDHWRGEYGYDEERQTDIDVAVCDTCVGTDSQLAKLKLKYKSQPAVLTKLDKFEPDIEPEDSADNAAFCKRARGKHDVKQ